ncbi:transcription elongation factor GreA [Vallitalea okinawensis]|uniref:transcription elongation factor GreA n=1 Tax=Vallitalea okinawensis TaxID=2078660 RepID=UPI000CFC7EA1|nr:transcription elongation factor GreA [Vallitalea okinawensis]
MADKSVVLTYDGLKKLEDELIQLKTIKRKEVAQKIKEARAQGDLSENAEYDAAKEEQGEVESRIAELEKLLKNATVIDEDEIELDKVSIGCKVKLFDVEFEEEVVYTIVGSTEANPMEGMLSNESPVGAAIIGKSAGEKVVAVTPQGELQFEVLDIFR